MKNFLRKSACGWLMAATALALHAEPALVGNKVLTGQALDAETVKAVLLGKKTTIGDTRVIIVIAKSSDAQDQFLQQSIGMNTSQFQNHWRRLFMTGGGSAPKIVETDADACKLASETAGAIAIADKTKADGLQVLASK
jgi:6-phosphofructokinase